MRVYAFRDAHAGRGPPAPRRRSSVAHVQAPRSAGGCRAEKRRVQRARGAAGPVNLCNYHAWGLSATLALAEALHVFAQGYDYLIARARPASHARTACSGSWKCSRARPGAWRRHAAGVFASVPYAHEVRTCTTPSGSQYRSKAGGYGRPSRYIACSGARQALLAARACRPSAAGSPEHRSSTDS